MSFGPLQAGAIGRNAEVAWPTRLRASAPARLAGRHFRFPGARRRTRRAKLAVAARGFWGRSVRRRGFNRGSLRRLKILRDINEGDPTIAKIVADFAQGMSFTWTRTGCKDRHTRPLE